MLKRAVSNVLAYVVIATAVIAWRIKEEIHRWDS